jgi:hypothetical protein
MTDRPAEHEQRAYQQNREPARRPGVTDHVRLSSLAAVEGWPCAFAVLYLNPSTRAKSQDPASIGRERSVMKASSPEATASPADR